MKIVAMIPARYEATRFPGKLLQDLGGKSVILRTYLATINTGLFDAVYVVNDSELIQKEILKNNWKVIVSKMKQKTGSDRIAEAVTLLNNDLDIVINVQGDEPFVNKKILQKLINIFKENDADNIDVASLIFPLTNIEEITNPNNVKVVIDNNNFALYFSRAPIPYPRDNNEAFYYQHIGVYAFRRNALINFSQLPMNMLEKAEKLENLRFISNGMRVKMVLTQEKSIGIDTPNDLEKARKRLIKKS
jgi:3-deoxy-D-manno-octulosonate cytidylyltransferase